MKNKDLLYALNEIDSTYISEAKGTKFKNRRRRWIALGIAAACICVVVGAQHFIHQDAPKSNESGNSQGNLPQPGQSLQEVQTGAISADFAIVQASYPECAPYPGEAEFDGNFSQEGEENYKAMMIKWASERKERVSRSEKYRNDLYSFYQTTMQEFLVNGENINRIYSPLNLYMALSMLTELSEFASSSE